MGFAVLYRFSSPFVWLWVLGAYAVESRIQALVQVGISV